MKIESLVAHVTPVGSPDRAEHDVLGMILDLFGEFRLPYVAGEAL